MIDKDYNEPIFAQFGLMVIRPKGIHSEYLYLYLISDTFKRLQGGFSISSEFEISRYDIEENMTVVLPKLSHEYYENMFEYFSNPRIRKYVGSERIRDEIEETSIEGVLDLEIANKIKAHNDSQLRSFLTEDLKELNVCYQNECWKSCLILAGSILEAVLIDWLSEMDHRDYFEEDYMIYKYGREQRGDLIDYINVIDRIKRPKWMKEASAAHEIMRSEKKEILYMQNCV